MRKGMGGISAALAVLIVIGAAASLWAAARRFRAEERNRRVEIGVEWPEVSLLAQMSQEPGATSQQQVQKVLARFKAQGVSTLIIPEDTLAALEQAGAVRATRVTALDGRVGTRVAVNDRTTFERIHKALDAHGIHVSPAPPDSFPPQGGTLFVLGQQAPFSEKPEAQESVTVGYGNLRTFGMGLPPEAVASAHQAGIRIAGRISNFPNVRVDTARAVLNDLRQQGAALVIYTGEEVLGYATPPHGQEKTVADMLRTMPIARKETEPPAEAPTGLIYGAVEFGKQKGDEKLTVVLRGDYVRVHSIQSAEMAQMDEVEAVERYVRGARERNIRFCYVRLLTQAGVDPIGDNCVFLGKIRDGLAKGAPLTGGGLHFGAARPFEETGVKTVVFGLIGLGVAAGIIWMLRLLCPFTPTQSVFALSALALGCAGLALAGGESGRKMVALLAGIAYPVVACLLVFPRPQDSSAKATGNGASSEQPLSRFACIARALRSLLFASAVTAIGILHVIGLLATRPFMLRANQFLGIKAQHAVPLLLIAFVAFIGGLPKPTENRRRFLARSRERLNAILDEPARFRLLILSGIALAALMLLVARTGNDAGVGVSGLELRFRAILDRILPVRPRTKEFLVGHPAFVLGLALWWRGRRRLALPCFVVGSLGQISLLNTFCHIHTPLIVSAWRDATGLIVGALFGSAAFLLIDIVLPKPRMESSLLSEDTPGHAVASGNALNTARMGV